MTEETWRQLGYGCRGRGCDTCFCECQTPDHLTKLMDGAVADLQALRESPLRSAAGGEMGGTLARWMGAFGEAAADAGGKAGRLCWYGTPSEAAALVRDLEATAGGCIGPQHLPLPPVPTGMFGYHCGVPLLCREQGGGFCWVEEAASA